MMKLKALLLLGFSSLILSGCGGSSNTTNQPNSNVQMSGAVVDWYVKDALVFADFNYDGILQPNIEPYVKTDAQGHFQLTINSPWSYHLISKGGIDSATDSIYSATLFAESGYRNITPITTIDSLLIQYGLSENIADNIVRQLIGMDNPSEPDDQAALDEDPASNQHLLAGARQLAILNEGLTGLLNTVLVAPTNSTEADKVAVKVHLSKEVWQMLTKAIYQNYRPFSVNQITLQTLNDALSFILSEYYPDTTQRQTVYDALSAQTQALLDIANNAAQTVISLNHAFGSDKESDKNEITPIQQSNTQTLNELISQIDTSQLNQVIVNKESDASFY